MGRKTYARRFEVDFSITTTAWTRLTCIVPGYGIKKFIKLHTEVWVKVISLLDRLKLDYDKRTFIAIAEYMRF